MIVRPKIVTYFYLSINYEGGLQYVKRKWLFSSLITLVEPSTITYFYNFKYFFLVDVDLFCNGVFLVIIYTILKQVIIVPESWKLVKVRVSSKSVLTRQLMKTFSTMWQPWSQEWCLVVSRCVFVYVEATFLLCCKWLSQGAYDLITWFRS